MPRWIAAIVAILTVVLSSLGGMIVGALVGNSIAPAHLIDFSGDPDHGLLLFGALLGVLGGFYLGIWAAMGIVESAAAKRAARGAEGRVDRPSRSDRSRATRR